MQEQAPLDEDAGKKIADSWLYTTFIKTAYRILSKPLAIFRLLKKTVAHLQKYGSIRNISQEAKEQILCMYRLVKAYSKGEYRNIPTAKIALSVAALLYFVSPFDIIPDFLPLGLTDDIALILWVFNNLREEMQAFLEWEDEQKQQIDITKED